MYYLVRESNSVILSSAKMRVLYQQLKSPGFFNAFGVFCEEKITDAERLIDVVEEKFCEYCPFKSECNKCDFERTG